MSKAGRTVVFLGLIVGLPAACNSIGTRYIRAKVADHCKELEGTLTNTQEVLRMAESNGIGGTELVPGSRVRLMKSFFGSRAACNVEITQGGLARTFYDEYDN